MLHTRSILPAIALLLSCETEVVDDDSQASDDDTQEALGDQIQIAGDLSSSELAGHCAQYERVDVGGSVILDDASSTDLTAVDCLGSVSGDLVIQGDALTEVSLPDLDFVGGDFLVSDLPSLQTLTVDSLLSVEGEINVIGNPYLQTASWSEICDVGASSVITNNEQLTTLNLASLMTVNETQSNGRTSDPETDGIEVRDNPQLVVLELGGLMNLVGQLTIGGNTNLNRIDMNSTHTIGGPVEIAYNPSLESIGFDGLKMIAGSLTITESPFLTPTSADTEETSSPTDFPVLTAISGDLRMEALSLYNRIYFPNLETVTEDIYLASVGSEPDGAVLSFENLTTLGGNLSVMQVAASTLNFEQLSAIPGHVIFSENAYLQSIVVLEGSTWSGHVRIENNASLSILDGFDLISTIGGQLEIRENPSLSQVSKLSGLATVGSLLDELPADDVGMMVCDMSLLFCDNPGVSIEDICGLVDDNLDSFQDAVYIYGQDAPCPETCPTSDFSFTEVCAGYCD